MFTTTSRLQGKFIQKYNTKIGPYNNKIRQIVSTGHYNKVMLIIGKKCEFHVGVNIGVLLEGQWANTQRFILGEQRLVIFFR